MKGHRGWSGAAALVAGATVSCANVEAPPGTTPDFAPPTVRERYPAPDAVVPELDGEVVLRFDEPIQSPRSLERLLDYSPAFDWRFTPLTNGFKARPRDGWRPDVVYRIRLEPGVSDLLRNRTTLPVEWSFSTGPAMSRTRVEGTIFDRVAVRGVRDARLLFLPPDSTPYTVVSDTGGVFSMRGLPPGSYTIFGFVDQNQNRRLDDTFEPWDSAEVVIADEDTRLALDLWMVPPDTTPPVLTAATAPDSLIVVLELDDPIDPEASLEGVTVSLSGEEGAPGPAVDSVSVGAPEAAADTLAPADTLAAADTPPDSVPGGDAAREAEGERAPPPDAAGQAAQNPDVERLREQRPPGAREQPPAEPRTPEPLEAGEPEQEVLRRTDLPPVPSTSVSVYLASPLRAGTWRVRATGLPNLRGLAGGGDTTFVYERPPPSEEGPAPGPEAAPIDSLIPAPADSLGQAPADSLGQAPADSLGQAPADNPAPVPPDAPGPAPVAEPVSAAVGSRR